MSEQIDLQSYFQEQTNLSTEIDRLRLVYEKAVQDHSRFLNESREKLKAMIEGGQTTGNKLQDEIIVNVGFDENLISKILLFNQKFKENAGKECLLIFSWRKQICFKMLGEPSDNDFVMETVNILGILSGEDLSISGSGLNIGVKFPFKRYVSSGDKTSSNGPYIIGHSFLEGPDSVILIEHMIGRNVVNPKDHGCQIWIGKFDFMENPFVVNSLRERLNAPTEDEKIRGAGI